MHLTSPETPAIFAAPRERLIEWLAERFGPAATAPGTTLAELEVDSLDWLDLTAEIERLCGVRLDGEAVSRIASIADLCLVLRPIW